MKAVATCICLLAGLGGCAEIDALMALREPARAAPQPEATGQAGVADEAASAAPGQAASGDLGTTIVSLGNPGEAGLWLKTPLVAAPGRGRVSDPATGRSVVVDLIPIAGAPGAGSRMSLAAFRAIGAGLTDLPELRVVRLP